VHKHEDDTLVSCVDDFDGSRYIAHICRCGAFFLLEPN
jgi:hypothetical protein